MRKTFYQDALGWGIALWLIGYVLGIVLFFLVPPALIGWVLTPIGTFIAFWVLWKKVQGGTMRYYASLSLIWTFLAIVLDYFLLVSVFKPADGYYKLDVYIYYTLTFLLPLVVGFYKTRAKAASDGQMS